MTTKEKIEELTTINFSINKCQLAVFKRFREFCVKETNDNYGFGLKLLLDLKDANAKEMVLYENYLELKEEVEIIKKGLDKPKKKFKTMGRKDEVKENE